jgi:hypothetical protein
VEREYLILIRKEPSPAQGGAQERRMDGDDGSKAALRTPNRDDVLVFRPRQPLQHFA